MSIIIKKCRDCKEEKEVKDFYKLGERMNGTIRYMVACKSCTKAKQNKRYKTEKVQNYYKARSKRLANEFSISRKLQREKAKKYDELLKMINNNNIEIFNQVSVC